MTFIFRLADERRRVRLLAVLAAIEAEPTLLGASAHLLAVARRSRWLALGVPPNDEV
jgi:hypothetical protein